jgi:hypothetical protein
MVIAIMLIVLAMLFAATMLDQLPLSQHAVEAQHALDADTIRFQMQTGICKPLKAYYCDQLGNKHYKIICPISETIWAGLIVGVEGQTMIVTGYPATKTYWDKAIIRDSCKESTLPSF